MKSSIQDFLNEVKSNNSFLILGHQNPDGDCYGSGYSLYQILKKIGKEVDLFMDKSTSYGLCKIFDQSLLIDKDKLEKDYDIAICVDCSSRLFLYGHEELSRCKKIICIDHHYTNEKYGDINIIDISAASCGEIVFDIIKDMDKNYNDVDTFTYLYTSISTDTGSFSYSNTTYKTHLIASELLKAGIDIGKINDLLKVSDKSKIDIFKYALNNIISLYEGRVLIVNMDKEISESTDGIVDFIRYIKGCDIACLIKKVGNEEYKISLRSANPKIDVAKIATFYGGGGHKKAAGFSYRGKNKDLIKEISNLEEFREC